MIRYKSQKQRTIEAFTTSFEKHLDANNRWVKLSECIPWDDLAEGYYQNLHSTHGGSYRQHPSTAGAPDGAWQGQQSGGVWCQV